MLYMFAKGSCKDLLGGEQIQGMPVLSFKFNPVPAVADIRAGENGIRTDILLYELCCINMGCYRRAGMVPDHREGIYQQLKKQHAFILKHPGICPRDHELMSFQEIYQCIQAFSKLWNNDILDIGRSF